MKRRSVLAAVGLVVLSFAAVARASDRELTVTNHFGAPIKELSLFPSSSTSYRSPNLLDRAGLANDASAVLHYPAAMARDECLFDIEIVYGRGVHEIVTGINLCGASEVTLLRGEDGALAFGVQ